VNDRPDRELRLGHDAQVALEALMDEYAGRLVKDAIALSGSENGPIELAADDLCAAASAQLATTAAAQDAERDVGDLVTMLRLGFAAGLTLLAASIAAVAATLLPEAVDDTSARIWIGVGMFAALCSSLAGVGLYLARHVGVETVSQWLTPKRAAAGDSSSANDTTA
jgi:hypothetical protein